MSITQRQCRLLADTLALSYADSEVGAPILLLHGGAGPASMAGLAQALSGSHRVVVPVHPGFNGEPRPDWLRTIDGLATVYLAMVERLGLEGVMIVGNSVGGWIAAEIALRRSPRVKSIILLNAVGIDTGSPDRIIVDPMAVPPAARAALAFHDPARFSAAPQTPEGLQILALNQRTLRVYAGEPFMHAPDLRDRLASLNVPALVIWGEGDRIVDLQYGRRFAASMPIARFEPITGAGHFPQIEKLEVVRRLIEEFVTEAAV